MILLDTDVCLSLLKGNRKLLEVYGDSTEELCVSSITAQELFLAANLSENPAGNKQRVEQFLLTLRILHPDLSTLQLAAELQLRIRRRGGSVSFADILLHSLSKAYNAKLVTTEGKRYCFT